MYLRYLATIFLILFCFAGTEGCFGPDSSVEEPTSQTEQSIYSDKETFIIEAEHYVSYQFVLLEGDSLYMSVKSQSGPANMIITDSSNFNNYEDAEFYQYYEYYENVIEKEIQFTAPVDGEYYLILENNGLNDITVEVSYETD